ncbi:MAG TPA: hypothetical protein VL742_08520 [Casimicrobiaceae bacterium]|nr:hypothetical protein [Casimicrobiaceae bacterium]
MTILALAAPVLAFLRLAAHFFRAGNLLALCISLLAIVLIFVRRQWAARAMQALLALGALERPRTAVTLVYARSVAGQSVTRLALILGAVFLLTAGSALVVQAKRFKTHFNFPPRRRPMATKATAAKSRPDVIARSSVP